MDSRGKISIIVPVYNVEKWIRECLESLAQQTYSEYEIILVDDGSTDKSGSICDKFAKKNTFTRVLHQKNQGVSVARNNGIKHATGKYIVFVDPDDIVAKEYLEVLVDTINFNSADMAIVGYSSKHSELLNDSYKEDKVKEIKAEDMLERILDGRSFDSYLWNKIFVTSIIENNDILFEENISLWEDLYFVVKYLRCINKSAYVKRVLYFYRQRQNSAVKSKSINKLNSKVRVCSGLINMNVSRESLFFRRAIYLYVIYLTEYGFQLLKDKSLSKEQARNIYFELQKYRWVMPKSFKYFMKYILIKMRYII